MKTLGLLFHGLFLTVNIVIAIFTVVSAYSDRISPDSNLFFSYLGLAFPILCIFNVLCIIYWLCLGKWKVLLISLCAIGICWGPLKRYFPFHSQEKSIPQENVIKVLTYNVMAFGYKSHTKMNPNKIIKYIIESDADIVCMQEYAENKSPKNLTKDKIYDALSMYPYRSVTYLNESKFQNMGIAVFSKYPITNSRRIKYESRFNGSSIHQIDVKGKKLMLINNHLESFKLTMEDRSRYSTFIKSLTSDGLDELRGAFQQKLGPAFQIRARQSEAVSAEIKKLNNKSILVCGDFNDTPISYAHRTIQGDLTDAFAESGRGMGITYNQNFFWFRIDNILHSPNMQAINCTVDKVKFSDHYPLWCYLQLN